MNIIPTHQMDGIVVSIYIIIMFNCPESLSNNASYLLHVSYLLYVNNYEINFCYDMYR